MIHCRLVVTYLFHGRLVVLSRLCSDTPTSRLRDVRGRMMNAFLLRCDSVNPYVREIASHIMGSSHIITARNSSTCKLHCCTSFRILKMCLQFPPLKTKLNNVEKNNASATHFVLARLNGNSSIGYNIVWSGLCECNEHDPLQTCCNLLISW